MPVFGQLEEFVSADRLSAMQTIKASPRSAVQKGRKKMPTWLRRNKSPILRAPVHVIIVVHLIEFCGIGTRALDRSIDAAIPHQRSPDLSIGVRLRRAGHDAGVLEERVRVQRREQLQRLLEVIHHLLRGHVVGVAGGVKGTDAGAVFAPFVLPKRLVVAPIVLPVYGHVV